MSEDEDRTFELMRSAYRIGYVEGYRDSTELAGFHILIRSEEFIERVRQQPAIVEGLCNCASCAAAREHFDEIPRADREQEDSDE